MSLVLERLVYNSVCLFQLNDVLMPNPFDRPRAVFMLDVQGTGSALGFKMHFDDLTQLLLCYTNFVHLVFV